MKKIILITSLLLIVLSAAKAQDVFKKYGHNKEMLTLSKGKYQEVFKNEDVVQIGTVLINTKTDKVVQLLDVDITKTNYTAELSSRFLTVDPLAERFPWNSPYVFCSNNPVNRIDPDGRADFWHNGRVLGNDGVDDQRILALKTTQKSFGSEADGNLVPGAGLSRKDLNATVKFIKNNSGNSQAFQDNGMAYTNSIAIESSADNRQTMVTEVSRDDGKGGTVDANNREYGGSIQNGVVVLAKPGQVAVPGKDATASIMLPVGYSTFHSHPSGSTDTHSWSQTPSPPDVTNAGGHTNYVFGRSRSSSNNVYIYNSNGVQAVIPMRYFVNPRR